MEHFRLFVLPFYVGAIFMAVVIVYKYTRWFLEMTPQQRRTVGRGLLRWSVLWRTVVECVRECLLHFKIWKRNPMLGYMHTTFALGWFLLIMVGWIETMVYFRGESIPLYVDIFFSYYVHPVFERAFNFSFIKDALLLLLLLGVGIALFKRIRSRALGLRHATRHVWGDRVALTALWLIFPARLLAESMTSAEIREFGGVVWSMSESAQIIPAGVGCGSFLTNNVGQFLAYVLPGNILQGAELPAWWLYSLTLGLFFVAMPFSRYMHIFTEIPLIFMRNAGVRVFSPAANTTSFLPANKNVGVGYDKFQTAACSRCGICVDPCQLLSDGGVSGVQSVYFLRDKRYGKLTDSVANNCLMCGRCEAACPVGLELNSLRLAARRESISGCDSPLVGNYSYLDGVDGSQGVGRVGYFAGCMTLLTPKIGRAMSQIFNAAGEDVWYADRDGGTCCGRPLKLSGQLSAAADLIKHNRELFIKHGITTLVTSCPICLKVFKEDYNLEGITVLHHSQYIADLLTKGRIKLSPAADLAGGVRKVMTYHDPCELGRGLGIYAAPRAVVAAVGTLVEVNSATANGAGGLAGVGSLCCGSSLANTVIDDATQHAIGAAAASKYATTGAETLVTACPLCKKAFARDSTIPVEDLAEVVAAALAS